MRASWRPFLRLENISLPAPMSSAERGAGREEESISGLQGSSLAAWAHTGAGAGGLFLWHCWHSGIKSLQTPASMVSYGVEPTHSLTTGYLRQCTVEYSALPEIQGLCAGAHAGSGLYGSDVRASYPGRSGTLTSGRRLLQTDALGSSASSAASSLQSAVQAVTSSQGLQSYQPSTSAWT